MDVLLATFGERLSATVGDLLSGRLSLEGGSQAWSATWLQVHAFATVFMTGLAWFVQVVHYPLMARVGEREWVEYERLHTLRTTLVVMPVMLAEATAALWLAWCATSTATFVGLFLLAVLWISTILIQVPQHARLQRGFEARVHSQLVAGSWIRTCAWSIRALLAVSWLGPGSA